jgi:hypothetical protein
VVCEDLDPTIGVAGERKRGKRLRGRMFLYARSSEWKLASDIGGVRVRAITKCDSVTLLLYSETIPHL